MAAKIWQSGAKNCTTKLKHAYKVITNRQEIINHLQFYNRILVIWYYFITLKFVLKRIYIKLKNETVVGSYA